ncbi:MAG: TonB-dependent receptor [Porticoccaceae bacterium]|jgi:iron complex outermembrane recepter protein|nr:TonB-dependent receptor [Porticoccaceae bacterium]
MNFRNKSVRQSIALCAGLVIAAPTLGQIEEILVTAQKREESLQDVPISVNALAGDMFDQFDVSRTDDLEKVFANIGTNRNSGGNTGFAIRGVGTDNVHLSGQQSVGTYIDDVSMVSPFVGAIGVYDVDRVEVLRGPQNTLYGRNTTGGAVVWHTNQATPGDGTSGNIRLRAGNGGKQRFEGAVGFDLTENVAGRIAGFSDSFDGVWTNVLDGSDTGGASESSGARVNLVWDSGENASVSVTLSTGEIEGEDLAVRLRGNRLSDGTVDPEFENARESSFTGVTDRYVIATAADVASQPFLQADYDASNNSGRVIDNPDPSAGLFTRLVNFSTPFGQTWQDPEDGYNSDWNGLRIGVDYSFESFDLTSITSFDETSTKERNGQELTGFVPNREGEWETWQQELRFTSTTDGSLQWLAGLYLTGSESKEDTWVANTGGAGGMGVTPGIDINSEYNAVSAYVQLDKEITDALTLTGGVRYTDDKLSADNDNWVRTVCGFTPSAAGSQELDRDFRAANCPGLTPGRLAGNTDSPVQELSELGWKLGFDYSTMDGSLLWGSVSKGFKGGSYDNRALSTGDDPVDPEFMTAYELGYKADFMDNTLQMNASYFFYEWEDLQLFESYGGVPAIVNVPLIELKGVELEVKWAPDERWYFQGSLGTVDSEVTDITGLNPLSQAQLGKEVTNTPDLTSTLFGSYSMPVGNSFVDLSLNYRYTSSMYYTFVQAEAVRDESDSHGYLDARIQYSFGENDQYSASLWGNNLTEEFACSSVIWGPGGAPQNYSCEVGSFGEALYGLTLEMNFD